MKHFFLLAISLFCFNQLATAQTDLTSINYVSAVASSPNHLTSNAELLKNSSKGLFNIYVTGFGVRDKATNMGYGGQVDAVFNFGKKVALGGFGSIQRIDDNDFTPVAAYGRLNFTSLISLQGGFAWYMSDFHYNFTDATTGYYAGVLLGTDKVKLDISGYFPDGEDYRITAGLKVRIFKL